MLAKESDLRVWWIPQVPSSQPFYVSVRNTDEAYLILNVLANYDKYQFERYIKPDYSNAGGLEVFEDGEWLDWSSEDGEDIWETMYE